MHSNVQASPAFSFHKRQIPKKEGHQHNKDAQQQTCTTKQVKQTFKTCRSRLCCHKQCLDIFCLGPFEIQRHSVFFFCEARNAVIAQKQMNKHTPTYISHLHE
jgi:hypothetical protein